MPQATSITVTDPSAANVVFAVLTPSAGDRQPALFRVENTLQRDLRPTLTIRSRVSGANSRRVEGTVSFPIVRTVDGTEVRQGNIPVDFSIVLPSVVTDGEAEYAATVAGNLITSALVQECLADGYAPV